MIVALIRVRAVSRCGVLVGLALSRTALAGPRAQFVVASTMELTRQKA